MPDSSTRPEETPVHDPAQMGSNVTRDELLAALTEARDLPDGDGKINALDRIVAYADAAGDVRLGVTARLTLVDAHHHTERWRMLSPFEWCLAAFDRDPTLFDSTETELLRSYHKWTVGTLPETSRVGLARTVASLADLERRLRSGGHSPQVAYGLRSRIADHVGDEATARHWLIQWRSAPRDGTSDCAGCDPASQAKLLAEWGRWTEAIDVVEPVLAGVHGCPEQPERALAVVQLAYLRLGRYDEAVRAHMRAYRRHARERDAFPFLADHLRFCALAGQHERGLDILARHLDRLDRPYDERSAMEFAAAGALLCRLAGAAGFDRFAIHRPAYGDRRAAVLTVAALGPELLAAAQDLAGRFDARNGTSHQSGRMAAWLAERPVAGPVPLPPDDSPDDGTTPDEPRADRAATGATGSDGTPDEPRGDRTARERHNGWTASDRPASGSTSAGEALPDRPPEVGPLSVAAIVTVLRDRAGQLAVLVNATLATGAACAAAVAALP